MLRSFAFALALIYSVPALAAGGDATVPSEQASKASPVREKKVCRTDRSVGTILPQRVCHTAAEWQAIEAGAATTRQRLQDDQDQRMQGATR